MDSKYDFFLCVLLTLCIFLPLPVGSSSYVSPESLAPVSKIQKALHAIYEEVVELGGYKGEDFIKREFWMNLDGRNSNKEEHVVVLRHDDGRNLRFTIQITYYTPDKGHRFIRYAKETKVVLCCIRNNDVNISRSDYTDKELKKLFPDVLKGIRNKKKLLKLVKREQ